MQYSFDNKKLQTVDVLNESDIIINKQMIHYMEISQPINFPGSPWKQKNTFQGLINPTSESPSVDTQDLFRSLSIPSTISSPLSQKSQSTNEPPLPAVGLNTASAKRRSPGLEETSFLNRLKLAPDIHSLLTEFINEFTARTPPPSEHGTIIRRFLDKMNLKIQSHSAWANSTNEDFDIAFEAIEKYILQKVYKLCFAPTPEDIIRDKFLYNRLSELSFLTEDHLDIPVAFRDTAKINLAIEELKAINSAKTPRGKLTRIVNAAKAIYSILSKAARGTNNVHGADDFFPIISFVLLKANPPQMHSNIQFITRFRAPSKLITESGYYFTQVETSLLWLEKLVPSQVTIDPDLFQKLLSERRSEIQAQTSTKGHGRSSSLVDIQATSSPSSRFQKDMLELFSSSPSVGSKPNTPNPTSSPSLSLSSNSTSIFNELTWHSNSTTPALLGDTTIPSLSASPSSISSKTRSPAESHGSISKSKDLDDISESSIYENSDSDSPLRFLNYTRVSDLKVSDLEDLFRAYRMLAHENFSLRTELFKANNGLR